MNAITIRTGLTSIALAAAMVLAACGTTSKPADGVKNANANQVDQTADTPVDEVSVDEAPAEETAVQEKAEKTEESSNQA